MLAINPKIKQKAEDIRKKIFGSEVRESLASGIEEISEDVEATIGRQDYVEEQFQDVLDETTGKDVINGPEVIAARNGKSNLKTRLDEEHAEVTAQLQQTEKHVESFINANLYSDMQTAINVAITEGKKLLVSSGTYHFTEGLIIDGNIVFEGLKRRTVFDFSQMTEGVAITIGNTKGINGLIFGGLTMIGNPNITAIQLNKTGTIDTPITDSHFKDMRIENFGLGLKGAFCWTNLFTNMRFQSCKKPMSLENQFNHALFNRVSFVSFSEIMEFSNCEGLHFLMPEIANVQAGIALRIFQSNITLDSPYIEYINGALAEVGRLSEVLTSTLVINSPRITDDKIRITLNGKDAIIDVRNPNKPVDVAQFGDNIDGGVLSSRIRVDKTKNILPQFLFKYDGESVFNFSPAYGGTTINTEFLNGEVRIGLTADGDYTGIRLSNQLQIGENYTLLYAVKREGEQPVFSNSGSVTMLSDREDYILYAFPFKARSTACSVIWRTTETIVVKKLALIKGQHFSW